jgi:catechol 2,3-dioxygenase-like lactoylglutathione lyase family enzyme
MIRVNHLIFGSTDVGKSQEFYVELFGFRFITSFVDTGTGREGRVLRRAEADGSACLELLVVPFNAERLPSPQHIAFEVDAEEFEELHRRAESLGLKVRAQPALSSPEEPPGTLEVDGFRYRNFYVLDPMRINVEVMVRQGVSP